MPTLPTMRGRATTKLVITTERPEKARKKKRPPRLNLGLSLDARLLTKLQDKPGTQSTKDQPPSVQRSFWSTTETGVVRTLLVKKESASSGIEVTFESNEQGITRFSRVDEGGPAAAAGAVVGDRLLSVNGTHTIHGATQASHLVAACAPGLIEMVVRRAAGLDKAVCHTVPLSRALVGTDLTIKEGNSDHGGKEGGSGGRTDDESSTDGSHSSMALDAPSCRRADHVQATVRVGLNGCVQLSLLVPPPSPARQLEPSAPTELTSSTERSNSGSTASTAAQPTRSSADDSATKPVRAATQRAKGIVGKAAPRTRTREYLALVTVLNASVSAAGNDAGCTTEQPTNVEAPTAAPQQEAFERPQKQCPRAEVGLLYWLPGKRS